MSPEAARLTGVDFLDLHDAEFVCSTMSLDCLAFTIREATAFLRQETAEEKYFERSIDVVLELSQIREYRVDVQCDLVGNITSGRLIGEEGVAILRVPLDIRFPCRRFELLFGLGSHIVVSCDQAILKTVLLSDEIDEWEGPLVSSGV